VVACGVSRLSAVAHEVSRRSRASRH
jgi:hypothetical protein